MSPIEPEEDLVLNIALALCDEPDQIEIERLIDERGVLIMLKVSKADLPRIIGKKGETANAIRSILRALGGKRNARYAFKVDSKSYHIGP